MVQDEGVGLDGEVQDENETKTNQGDFGDNTHQAKNKTEDNEAKNL